MSDFWSQTHQLTTELLLQISLCMTVYQTHPQLDEKIGEKHTSLLHAYYCKNIVSPPCKLRVQKPPIISRKQKYRGVYHKTYYGRNLRISVISKIVCP